jgi:hypothetical protein
MANNDPWDLVRAALSDDSLRTVAGISAETGISADDVQRLLDDHPGEVREAYVTDRGGRRQYTLKSRPMSVAELWATVRGMAANTP